MVEYTVEVVKRYFKVYMPARCNIETLLKAALNKLDVDDLEIINEQEVSDED